MVELEPVLSEEMINAEHLSSHRRSRSARPGRRVRRTCSTSDVERLHVLITRHAKLTGSKRAAEILANWKAWLPKFRKVMPVEYRRALKEMKANARRRAENRDRGVMHEPVMCERSEAIHERHKPNHGLLRRHAPRNDGMNEQTN